MRRRLVSLSVLLACGCGASGASDPDLAGYVPPSLSAKGDSAEVVVRTPIRFGQDVADTTAGALVLQCWPFEARDGAEVAFVVTGLPEVRTFLYGPLDAAGDFGAPIAEAEAAPASVKIVEDGSYRACLVATAADVAFAARLDCAGECGVDEALYRVRVNEASGPELLASGRLSPEQADALLARRDEIGFFATLQDVADAAGLPLADVEASFSLEWQRLFVSPKNGDGYGFADVNNAKTAPLLHGDGTVTLEPGSIVVPVKDLFDRATTSIDLVMYSFSSYGAELDALRNAVKRGVKVRAMLDISTGSPIPYNQRMILKLVECGVDVRVPKHKTKTLHQKFAIVDGIHVFNGSSNFSDKSSAVYAENRFFFQFRPEVAAQFQAEWDLLWDKLSAPAQVED